MVIFLVGIAGLLWRFNSSASPKTDQSKSQPEASLILNKLEFQSGETAGVLFQNETLQDQYLRLEEFVYDDENVFELGLEKLENSSWVSQSFVVNIRCGPAQGQGPVIGCAKIEAGQKLKRIVNLQNYTCVNAKPRLSKLDTGTYRLRIDKFNNCPTGETSADIESEVIYSQEFTIK